MKVRRGAGGLHLFDRFTGLNVLLDEVSLPSADIDAAPRQISVAVTNTCDLRCSFCYAPKQYALLNMDNIVAWLRILDKNGCLGVGFGGGEPTLYRGFAELCQQVQDQTSLAVTFTTHGHRLSEELCRKLAGSVNFVRISMDGIYDTYETIRRKPFKDLMSAIERVGGISLFGINYVVNSNTIADLPAAIELASAIGAQEFLILPERPVHGLGGISDGTKGTLHKAVNESPARIRLAVSKSDSEGFPFCDPLSSETGTRSYAHIDAAGTIKASSYDNFGVPILGEGVMLALHNLRMHTGEL